jgi:PucR C-terminal helix-turn-helix domain/GGDEF-like domain
MRRNPGFEPSVWSVLNSVLPDQWAVVGGNEHLHLRVSYPLIMRTTGLGRIEGGELVLVPPTRAREVLAGAADLCETGISGIVLFGVEKGELDPESIDCAAPVVAVAGSTELEVTRERINRYIVRRRRELFALEQQLHRTLIDSAIAGIGMAELLQRAAEVTGGLIVLDRGGEILLAPNDAVQPTAEDLARARRALDRDSQGRASNPGPPRMLSLEVAGGGERKGLVAGFRLRDDRQEEDEAVMAALASAISIVLTRAPVVAIPPLEEVLARRAGSRFSDSFDPEARWAALALPAGDVLPETLQRVASTETEGRGTRYVLAVSGQAFVVLTPDVAMFSWDWFLAALASRTRVPVSQAGLGRPYPGLEGAARSAREAVSALDHARGSIMPYEEVEVTVLLLSLANGEEFMRVRLGPLLDGSPAQRELLETLRVYLATGKNAKEAARRLAVHRNTLLYRLRRAQELLGLDWDDADGVFALDLALRLNSLPSPAIGAAGDTG